MYKFYYIEFIQDVAARGLTLVHDLSDAQTKSDLAAALLSQLIDGKQQVNQITGDTKIFEDGVLGKTPTG